MTAESGIACSTFRTGLAGRRRIVEMYPDRRTYVRITPRQHDVLRELTLDGASNEDIADRLEISYDTVRTHVKALMQKTGTHNRAALAVGYLRGRWRVTVSDYD